MTALEDLHFSDSQVLSYIFNNTVYTCKHHQEKAKQLFNLIEPFPPIIGAKLSVFWALNMCSLKLLTLHLVKNMKIISLSWKFQVVWDTNKRAARLPKAHAEACQDRLLIGPASWVSVGLINLICFASMKIEHLPSQLLAPAFLSLSHTTSPQGLEITGENKLC